jgi:DNA-binding transcriptional MocR family regulator
MLLPDLTRALTGASDESRTTSYFDAPVLPRLAELLEGTWPFSPEALTIVDGAIDALDRVIAATVRFGHDVIVEQPTFPPILDLLEAAGAVVHGVEIDDEGLLLEPFRDRLSAVDPVLVILQPRGHNPRGSALSRRRAKALAAVLRSQRAVVLEDDHAAYISTSEPVSLGSYLPDRTVTIRSFSKSHGPDLRLAAVGGAGEIIEAVNRRRLLGPAWSSRLLQSVLHFLLTDKESIAAVAHASQVYAARRAALVNNLSEHGVRVEGHDGINLWIPVPDEQSTLIGLAVRGVSAAPGSPFLLHRGRPEYIRVTCAEVDQNRAEIAEAIASAVTARPSRAQR